MFIIGESEVTFSPLFLHQAVWLENRDSSGSQQSDRVHCAQLLLAAGTKIESLSLYLKEKKDKKAFPLKLIGSHFSKLTGFNPKVIWGKEYIHRGRQTITKPNITFFMILSLNTKLFSGDRVQRKNIPLVWRAVLGCVTKQCNSLGYGDIIQATNFALSHRKSVFPLLFDPNTAYEGRTPLWFGHGCGHRQCWVFSSCKPAAYIELYSCDLCFLLLITYMVQTPPISDSFDATLPRGCKEF